MPTSAPVAEFYGKGSRALQDRFDTRRLADRESEVIVADEIDEGWKDWIETRDMFFLATVGADGQPTCSYKGGDPGFVRVVDAKTIAWPNYDGNGMYLSMGNIQDMGKVGILFIDFEHPNRVRVQGTATIHFQDPLMAEFPEAQFIVRLTVSRVFPNCPRYIHRMKMEKRSEFVPRENCATPIPGWKRAPWASDVLAKGDPARRAGKSR
jgi:uncharacterized protein